MLFSFILSLVVAAILIQVAVFSTTIYLHRIGNAPGADAASGGRVGVSDLALWLTTGICDERVGGGPPQAPRVHRRGRRSAQPGARGVLDRPARQRLPLRQGSQESGRRRALRARHQGGLVGPHACSTTGSSGSSSAPSLCAGLSALAGGCLRRAFTRSCTCSCCPRRSTASATTSATRTSTTRRPTSACSRCSPAAKGSTTTITGSRAARNSASGERVRSRVADHQAADRAQARQAVQDDRRDRRCRGAGTAIR